MTATNRIYENINLNSTEFPSVRALTIFSKTRGGISPITTEPTTQPSTKPSAPATTTTKKPSTVKVEKVTKGTKSFKVTWKKKTGVSGYQVQYATDKKFKKNKKTVTVAKKNATSKTIKKLKSKKTYYVRVRTYKIVNGKKVYSSWSKVKAVKTK